MALHVLLADDNRAFLTAVAETLQSADGIEVVATAHDGDAAVDQARALTPDVAVIDVEMPGGGPELAARLLAAHPGLRVMSLTGRDDEQTVVAMLAAGASGYVVKGSLDEDFAVCVRRCASGTLFVIAGCADGVRARLGETQSRPARPSTS
jgi:DNA-binding NarL/FixJ family response regulator